MKKMIKLTLVVSFALAAGIAAFVRNVAAAAAASEAASPRTLYLQNCARCHGANGKAQTELGKRLEADDLTTSSASTAKIIRTITNGRGDMPSFKKKLTTAQIVSIAGYVRSL